MARVRRAELSAEAVRRNREQLARLGAEVRASRLRRRLTQAQLGSRTGLGRMTVGRIERGEGGAATLDVWQRLAVALDRPLLVTLGADAQTEPADAGHLAIQELLLRLGRRLGYDAGFEAASRPADPARSIDGRWRHDGRRILLLLEAWNTIGDIGAGARSFTRKLAETEAYAIALGEGRPHRACGCWVVRSTLRNRALIGRYPEVFAARFPGSSERWVRALTEGTEPPSEPGLVWCDVAAKRLFAWRRRAG